MSVLVLFVVCNIFLSLVFSVILVFICDVNVWYICLLFFIYKLFVCIVLLIRGVLDKDWLSVLRFFMNSIDNEENFFLFFVSKLGVVLWKLFVVIIDKDKIFVFIFIIWVWIGILCLIILFVEWWMLFKFM